MNKSLIIKEVKNFNVEKSKKFQNVSKESKFKKVEEYQIWQKLDSIKRRISWQVFNNIFKKNKIFYSKNPYFFSSQEANILLPVCKNNRKYGNLQSENQRHLKDLLDQLKQIKNMKKKWKKFKLKNIISKNLSTNKILYFPTPFLKIELVKWVKYYYYYIWWSILFYLYEWMPHQVKYSLSY